MKNIFDNIDNDSINEYFKELDRFFNNELKITEEEIKNNLTKINNYLKNIDEQIKKAEEDGDELAYQSATNLKQLILTKLNQLEELSKTKISFKRG